MKSFILFIATGFGSGYIPKIPGTVGTLVGLLLFLLLKDLSPVSYGVTLIGFIFLSVWVATVAESCFQEKDSRKIVIDEVLGFLVSMAFVPFSWPNLLAAFILFRLFDISKPFPCRLIERRLPSGWGIVGDDVVAGIYANLVLQIYGLLTFN